MAKAIPDDGDQRGVRVVLNFDIRHMVDGDRMMVCPEVAALWVSKFQETLRTLERRKKVLHSYGPKEKGEADDGSA